MADLEEHIDWPAYCLRGACRHADDALGRRLKDRPYREVRSSLRGRWLSEAALPYHSFRIDKTE